MLIFFLHNHQKNAGSPRIPQYPGASVQPDDFPAVRDYFDIHPALSVERHDGEAHQHPAPSRHSAADFPARTGYFPVPSLNNRNLLVPYEVTSDQKKYKRYNNKRDDPSTVRRES